MNKCANCGKKRKLTAWVGEGSIMDWTHGNYTMWCNLCQKKAQLKYSVKYLVKQMARIPVLLVEILADNQK